jgi:hypothetical protein
MRSRSRSFKVAALILGAARCSSVKRAGRRASSYSRCGLQRRPRIVSTGLPVAGTPNSAAAPSPVAPAASMLGFSESLNCL